MERKETLKTKETHPDVEKVTAEEKFNNIADFSKLDSSLESISNPVNQDAARRKVEEIKIAHFEARSIKLAPLDDFREGFNKI